MPCRAAADPIGLCPPNPLLPSPRHPSAGLDIDPHEVMIRGGPVAPWDHWAQCQFPATVMACLTGAGFPHPSPIQAYAWPVLTEGRDLIGVAKTGSGKTLGYLLPPFQTMLQNRLDPCRAGGPLLLTLAPTRELACQIEVEAEKFGAPVGLRCALAYGGAPRGRQLQQIRRGPHVLIATPGRLNDYLKAGELQLRSVMYLVVDEADRMLDMGFEPQIRQIVAEVGWRGGFGEC